MESCLLHFLALLRGGAEMARQAATAAAAAGCIRPSQRVAVVGGLLGNGNAAVANSGLYVHAPTRRNEQRRGDL